MLPRLASRLWVVAVFVALAAPATAAPCQKPRQLKLAWDAKTGQGQLVFVTYGCGLPAACPTKDGTLATKLPLKVTLASSGTNLFSAELKPCADPATCRSINKGGCVAGTDAHKAADGMVKFTYQKRGTAAVMARARGPMKKPAETLGPVTATLTDAAGYSAEVEFKKCRFNSRETGATMICI